MLFISGFFVLVVALFVMGKVLDNPFFEALGLVTGLLFFIALVFIPINRMDCNSHIHQIRSIQQTIDSARIGDRDIERAAFAMKIAEANSWLASAKYYNDTIFDIYVPDEVENIESIK